MRTEKRIRAELKAVQDRMVALLAKDRTTEENVALAGLTGAQMALVWSLSARNRRPPSLMDPGEATP